MILEFSQEFSQETLLGLVRAITFPDWIKPEAFHIGPLSIKWYGLSYIIGLFGAYYYANRSSANKSIWEHAKAVGEPVLVPNKRMLEDLMFFSLIGIIVGGRIGFILLYGLEDYIKDPARIFKVWEGGMAFHGGFLGVCVTAIYLARSRKLELMRVADILAISAPIGLGLVRLANFVNQELVGRETDVPWAFKFYNPEYDFYLNPRHPSQLYEAFLEGLVVFSVLWIASRKFKILTKPGLATGMFLAMYGSFRIFVEFFREPDATLFGPLTRGMTYSLPMVIIGVLVILWASKRAPTAPEWPPVEVDNKADANP